MKTLSFIGSDKNAGKTTTLNLVYRNMLRSDRPLKTICLTSIGINGEDADSFENRPKPLIRIFRNSLFVTAAEHLRPLAGKFEILDSFRKPRFSKAFALSRSLADVYAVLEGPNSREELLEMKSVLAGSLPGGICLLDGSIDRQFIGQPEISDEICFAVVLTNRKEQLRKAENLLHALSISPCTRQEKNVIAAAAGGDIRSLLFTTEGEVLYAGREIPFLDSELKETCRKYRDNRCALYLNGSLPQTLHRFLAPFSHLRVVLDNFTCYQAVSLSQLETGTFRPGLAVYHSVPVRVIFLKQESKQISPAIPGDIPVHNLYRESPDEIGI